MRQTCLIRQKLLRSIDFISLNLNDNEWLEIYPIPSFRGDISVSVNYLFHHETR
jgi:hypothetical protein